MDVLGFHAVLVAENPAHPETAGVEPTRDADALALQLRRLFERGIVAHEDVGVTELTIGKNRYSHKWLAPALERAIVCQRKFARVVIPGQELFVAIAIVLE